MAAEASTLKKEMEQQLTEIKALILATGQAKGPIQQMQLKERTDAVSAAWIAKDLMYVDLVVSRWMLFIYFKILTALGIS